jgi:hypothetical protein
MAALAISRKRQAVYEDSEAGWLKKMEYRLPINPLPDVLLDDICIPINDKATCFNRKPSPPTVHHKNTKQAKQKAQRKARAINRR